MATKIFWVAIAVATICHVFSLALQNSIDEQDAQALETELRLAQPAPRFIHFKLPIAQCTYHWAFDDRDAFLSGALTLDIVRDEQREQIIVFENGRIAEGWEESARCPEDSPSKIYFGFVSRQKYSIANTDHVEMTLHVPADVPGGGPHRKGILRAEEYRATNKVTIYSTREDTAFLRKQDWNPQWDVTITDETGWKTEE